MTTGSDPEGPLGKDATHREKVTDGMAAKIVSISQAGGLDMMCEFM